jgi:outer membrane protein
VRLQDTLPRDRARQLELARARAQVGVGTVLDVRRAEVTVGQTEVARLQAANQAEIERLRPVPAARRRAATRRAAHHGFALTPVACRSPTCSRRRAGNPTLNAFRARERQSQLNVRAAQSQYLPSLNLQATSAASRSR